MDDQVTGSAPAKIILLGEHAVVYGHPAIALPLSSLRAYASITASDTPYTIRLEAFDDQIVSSQESEHPLIKLSQFVFDACQIHNPLIKVSIHSDIPVASGLGSGAAVSTALIRGLLTWFHVQWTNERINQLVFEIEKIYHGTPSGIDNTVISYEKPVYFIKGQAIEFLEISKPFHMIVGDTGIVSPTINAVSDVRKLYKSDENMRHWISDIGEISIQAKRALHTGDIEGLSALMNQNHTLLQRITVSCDALDVLVESALQAGAYGAKLSGGGRGGNMIALAPEEKLEDVEQALYRAGAKQVFKTVVKATLS